MPVVRVHDVGRPALVELAGGQVRAHPAEQREALQVVGPFGAVVVLVGAAVAAVQVRRVDHVGRHVAARQPAEPQRDARSAEQRTDLADGLRLQHGIGDRRQARQQQAHVGAGASQRRRQRADHVGQAAGLDERKDLAPRPAGHSAWRSTVRRRRTAAVRAETSRACRA